MCTGQHWIGLGAEQSVLPKGRERVLEEPGVCVPISRWACVDRTKLGKTWAWGLPITWKIKKVYENQCLGQVNLLTKGTYKGERERGRRVGKGKEEEGKESREGEGGREDMVHNRERQGCVCNTFHSNRLT